MQDKYNPKDFEEKLYQEWEEKGYFKPSMDKTKESYCIMMPPPNVTGKLHMGHALDDTIFIDKEFRIGCVNVTPFSTQLTKHLKLKRMFELIINYSNKNRKEYV